MVGLSLRGAVEIVIVLRRRINWQIICHAGILQHPCTRRLLQGRFLQCVNLHQRPCTTKLRSLSRARNALSFGGIDSCLLLRKI